LPLIGLALFSLARLIAFGPRLAATAPPAPPLAARLVSGGYRCSGNAGSRHADWDRRAVRSVRRRPGIRLL